MAKKKGCPPYWIAYNGKCIPKEYKPFAILEETAKKLGYVPVFDYSMQGETNIQCIHRNAKPGDDEYELIILGSGIIDGEEAKQYLEWLANAKKKGLKNATAIPTKTIAEAWKHYTEMTGKRS